jgi:hypothetical protein
MTRRIRIRGIRKGEFAFVIVDNCRHAELSGYRWHLGTDGYARRKATKAERDNGAPFFIAMHRQILGLALVKGAPGLPEIDHRNRKRRHNTRRNLRVIARIGNCNNTTRKPGKSGRIGVSWFKPARRWKAYINHNRQRIELGYFKTFGAAVSARAAAERKYGK